MRLGRLLPATLVVLALGVLGASGKRAKTPPCAEGRFLVTSGPFVTDPALGPVPVALAAGQLAIGSACPPVTAKLRAAKRQRTTVRATWAACAGYQRPVKLRATIDAACATMSGTVTSRRPKLKAAFEAARSVCGDGLVDAGAGEACETDAECAGVPCTECACGTGGTTLPTTSQPSTTTSSTSTSLPATTSTSTSTTTSSSTSVTTTTSTSTTFDGSALAPDYIMFTGAETESASEINGDNGCLPVTSPVRSGVRACRIALGVFTQLRHVPFNESTLYVRVYHRIDVATPPSAEAFAPVIVTDVLPQGVTAVDVGVDTDGSIRYRLRNRITGTNLGFTGSFTPGQWIRLELKTTIGAGTGSAELRVDGATAVSAASQDFGSIPLNTVFLSNNPTQYGTANGGSWTAYFDDIAITRNQWPGPARVIARQGRAGAPADTGWTLVGAASIDAAWSQTPTNNAQRAESPALGDPLAQTMLVGRLDQGVDPIGNHNTVKACQVWLNTGVASEPPNRTYAIRRRVGGNAVDTVLAGLAVQNAFRSEGLEGVFWRDTLANLNGAEIGAVKSGGAGGNAMRVADAWLACEYQ